MPPHTRVRYTGAFQKRNRLVSVPRNKLGFPKSIRTTLRYSARVEFDVDSLSQMEYNDFRGNGLFDPDGSVGGHQPRGFDEFMAIYKTFTVLRSKLNVNWGFKGYDGPTVDSSTGFLTQNFIQTTADPPALTPCMVGIYKGVESLPTTSTAAELIERDNVVWKNMTPVDGGCITSMSGHTGSMLGKKGVVGADGYTGSISADPANQWHYTIWAARTSNNTAGKVYVVAYVTIEYDVVFTEAKLLDAS